MEVGDLVRPRYSKRGSYAPMLVLGIDKYPIGTFLLSRTSGGPVLGFRGLDHRGKTNIYLCDSYEVVRGSR